MFTIKLKTGDGGRTIIQEAESFSILRPSGGNDDFGSEITLHRKNGADDRFDILPSNHSPRPEGWPPVFQVAYIENAMGRTVEIVGTRGPESERIRAA
jgi:hypothetical protein